MKRFIVAAVLIIASVNTYGQKVITWNQNKPLQWEYFAGKADNNSHFDAESYCEISYTYNFLTLQDFTFDVKATFHGNTSWIKNDLKTPALLKHEQTHFDIAELYARKLQNAFDNYKFTHDFKNEIEQIFKRFKKEYHQMQDLYDEQTSHSLNKLKQKEWEMFIDYQLNRTDRVDSGSEESLYASN